MQSNTSTTAQPIIYTVVRGDSPAAANAGAYSNEFVVATEQGTTRGFLRTKGGLVRIFTSKSGARKAITRERRGDYHR